MSESGEKKNPLKRVWQGISEDWRPWAAAFLSLAVSAVVVFGWAWLSPLLKSWGGLWGRLAMVETQTLIIVWLAMLTVGFTIWRGQQTDKQIKKSAEQIDEARAQVRQAQRQTSDQNFNNALSMATDIDSPARVRAGFTRLIQLYEGAENKEEAEKYLHAAQNAARATIGHEDHEKRYTPSLARQAALEFLMKYPLAEWEESEEWRLGGCDLSHLDFQMLLPESAEHCASRAQWKFVAFRSNCEKMKIRYLNLSNADFRGANLTDASFLDNNLTSADLSLARLTNAQLPGVDLTNAALVGANLTKADLWKADLTQSKLASADLTNASLSRAKLNGADLRGAILVNTSFNGAVLAGADLTNINRRARTDEGPKTDLTGADLTGANLTGANLVNADLQNANLKNANLTHADLAAAKLLSVNMENADLTSADLRKARLEEVVFNGTRVDGADFLGAGAVRQNEHGGSQWVKISPQALKGCCWDQSDDANKPLGINPYDLDDIPRGDEPAK